MDLDLAQQMARSLMDEHGLAHVPFKFDNARTYSGCLNLTCIRTYEDGRRRGRIKPGSVQIASLALSRHFTLARDEVEVRNTITHEIAHALAGPEANHGPEWRAIHLSLGGDGQRCGTGPTPETIKKKWIGLCSAGHETSMHRAPQRVKSCSRCSPVFNPAHLIEWKQDGQVVLMPARYTAEMSRLKQKYPDALVHYTANGNRRSVQEIAQYNAELEEVFAQLDDLMAMPA